MSDNYRLYAKKISEQRARRLSDGPLRSQLEEILETVRQCEAAWALEDIERDLRADA
jgi:hypothetical protein